MKEYLEIDNGLLIDIRAVSKEMAELSIDQIRDIPDIEKDLRKLKLAMFGKKE